MAYYFSWTRTSIDLFITSSLCKFHSETKNTPTLSPVHFFDNISVVGKTIPHPREKFKQSLFYLTMAVNNTVLEPILPGPALAPLGAPKLSKVGSGKARDGRRQVWHTVSMHLALLVRFACVSVTMIFRAIVCHFDLSLQEKPKFAYSFGMGTLYTRLEYYSQ